MCRPWQNARRRAWHQSCGILAPKTAKPQYNHETTSDKFNMRYPAEYLTRALQMCQGRERWTNFCHKFQDEITRARRCNDSPMWGPRWGPQIEKGHLCKANAMNKVSNLVSSFVLVLRSCFGALWDGQVRWEH